MPIVDLNANLNVSSTEPSVQYTFPFPFTSSTPLLSGQSIQSTLILIGAGFDSSQSYPLTVNGVFDNGSVFSFIQQVTIVPPS